MTTLLLPVGETEREREREREREKRLGDRAGFGEGECESALFIALFAFQPCTPLFPLVVGVNYAGIGRKRSW